MKNTTTTKLTETNFGFTVAPTTKDIPSVYSDNVWDIAGSDSELSDLMGSDGQYTLTEINEKIAETINDADFGGGGSSYLEEVIEVDTDNYNTNLQKNYDLSLETGHIEILDDTDINSDVTIKSGETGIVKVSYYDNCDINDSISGCRILSIDSYYESVEIPYEGSDDEEPETEDGDIYYYVFELDNITDSDVTFEVGETYNSDYKKNYLSGVFSEIEGSANFSQSNYSHIEGYANQLYGDKSHMEGDNNFSCGSGSHIEGSLNTEEEDCGLNHIEGSENIIHTGISYSHVEGEKNNIYSNYSHAEGYNNIINSNSLCSHVSGGANKVEGNYSFATGYHVNTSNNYELSCGTYNASHTSSSLSNRTCFSIGVGYNDYSRKNAFEVMQNGDIYLGNSNVYKQGFSSSGADSDNLIVTKSDIKNVQYSKLFRNDGCYLITMIDSEHRDGSDYYLANSKNNAVDYIVCSNVIKIPENCTITLETDCSESSMLDSILLYYASEYKIDDSTVTYSKYATVSSTSDTKQWRFSNSNYICITCGDLCLTYNFFNFYNNKLKIETYNSQNVEQQLYLINEGSTILGTTVEFYKKDLYSKIYSGRIINNDYSLYGIAYEDGIVVINFSTLKNIGNVIINTTDYTSITEIMILLDTFTKFDIYDLQLTISKNQLISFNINSNCTSEEIEELNSDIKIIGERLDLDENRDDNLVVDFCNNSIIMALLKPSNILDPDLLVSDEYSELTEELTEL